MVAGTFYFAEMLCGHPPFELKKGESNKDLDKKIISERFVLPPFLQANTVSLLKGMLEKDMNKRLGSAKTTMFNIGGVATLKITHFSIIWTGQRSLIASINLP